MQPLPSGCKDLRCNWIFYVFTASPWPGQRKMVANAGTSLVGREWLKLLRKRAPQPAAGATIQETRLVVLAHTIQETHASPILLAHTPLRPLRVRARPDLLQLHLVAVRLAAATVAIAHSRAKQTRPRPKPRSGGTRLNPNGSGPKPKLPEQGDSRISHSRCTSKMRCEYASEEYAQTISHSRCTSNAM